MFPKAKKKMKLAGKTGMTGGAIPTAVPMMGGSHSLHQSIEAIHNGFVQTTRMTRYNPDAKKDEDRYQEHEVKTYHRVHPGLHKAVKGMAKHFGAKLS